MKNKKKILVLIPTRLNSRRLPAKALLPINNLPLIMHVYKRETYKLLDRFEYVFTIDSTLGLENLARGGRTGFIGNTPNTYPLSTRKFGWNENLPKNGKFWTSENSHKEFQRIFDFVTKGKKKEWIKEFSAIKKIIKFDEKNKIFFNIINKILD